ncbi:MAG: aminotransferase class IV [Parvibaculum sp.]|uniref:aminotransferase class IV n=1 Tax=Parvibaculum sp. TaxID=2024848 RepID=UPI002719DC3E|nr:aminotransferase class IV [Parvibaculum sp.]MDO8837848.1 aminotransferase class IV [Parvibaculum sp.]
MIVWLNGELAPAGETRIDPTDRGFLLGDGLFETMLVRRGRVVFLDAHLLRLRHGANAIGLALPFDPARIAAACTALLDANRLADAPRAALRLTLTRGPGPRGLALPADPKPTLLITAASAAAPPAGLSAIVATPRRNNRSPSAQLKAIAYLDNVLAKEEARARGAEEALMFNIDGHLACASAANIFIWDGDRLITPSVDCGILAGITRAAILELAPDFGIEVLEDRIEATHLSHIGGAFLTSSLMGMVPLTRIDGKALPAHPETARLNAAYELLLDAAERNG